MDTENVGPNITVVVAELQKRFSVRNAQLVVDRESIDDIEGFDSIGLPVAVKIAGSDVPITLEESLSPVDIPSSIVIPKMPLAVFLDPNPYADQIILEINVALKHIQVLVELTDADNLNFYLERDVFFVSRQVGDGVSLGQATIQLDVAVPDFSFQSFTDEVALKSLFAANELQLIYEAAAPRQGIKFREFT